MFDWYIPDPPLVCPKCGQILDGWQGKDGPCGLMVWRQGTTVHPVDQQVEDEVKWSPEELRRFRLPERFVISTMCCNEDFSVDAICTTKDGVWSDTRLATADDVEQLYYWEPKAKRATRRAWLGEQAV